MEYIGRYQVLAELGKGAMGVVYKATDPNIGRTVAIKTLRFDIHGWEADEMLRRFKNEARAAGAMNHPNIITIYDAGEHEGMFYIAMEFIEGRTLQELLKQEKMLPVERVTDIVRQVCAGLDYAHARGIIHRDIKPANIMITDAGIKIMDFGIAKGGGPGMTSTGQVLGTPSYMSPEQVKGKPLDRRSDLFSVGVVLYEMITGERPFPGESVTTIMYKIVNETPPAPRDLDASVHPGLSAVVMKVLAKSPEQRYATGADFARDLQHYESLGTDTDTQIGAAPIVRPVASTTKTVAEQPRAAVRRPAPAPKNTGAMAGIVAAVVVVALAAGVYLRSHRAVQPSNAPPAETAQLQALKGFLSVNSDPAGAAIYVDGRDTGQVTPSRVTVNPGQHHIAIRKEGFKPQITETEVAAGEIFNVAADLAPVGGAPQNATSAAAPQSQGANPFRKFTRLFGKAPADDGVLKVSTRPQGAEVWLGDSKVPSKTPVRLAVTPGTYKLTLRLPGHKPITRSVQIEKGKPRDIKEVFAPK